MMDEGKEEAKRMEGLADEIAHDLVAAPADDATPEMVEATLRFVGFARVAALEALRAGANADMAMEAATIALTEHDADPNTGGPKAEDLS